MFSWLKAAFLKSPALWVATGAAVVVGGYFAAPYVKHEVASLLYGRNGGGPIDEQCLNVTGTFNFNPSPIANPNGNGTVTLTGGGPTGFSSTLVTVRSLTPGVSVTSPAQQIFFSGLINGTWALTGLTPGQYITLSIDAVSPGHGSKPGTDKCCSATIYLKVPGDINLAVLKTTSMTPDGSEKGGAGYQFTLQATNTADPINYTNVVSVSDVVPAGLEFTNATGPNWNCGSSGQYPIAAASTLTCVYTGPVPIATGALLPPITVSASVVGSPTDTIQNCATIAPVMGSGYIDTVATDNQSCVDIFPQFTPHDHVPPFKPKCGMDVLFVVDESYSIYQPDSGPDQTGTVRNALIAAAHAFAGNGTNANAHVIFFGTNAGFGGWGGWQPLTNANANNIANGYDPGDLITPTSLYNYGYDTNWDAALRLAYSDLQAHGQPNGPVLVVFITDGRPNYFVDPSNPPTPVAAAPGSPGEVDSTNHAIVAVDNIYSLNDKIIGIGIGPFMTNPPQPNAVPNGTIHLQALLGGNAPPVNAGGPFDPSTSNVIVSGTYGTLGGSLLGLAGATCPNIQLGKGGSTVYFGPDDFGTDGHLNATGLAKLGGASVKLTVTNLSAIPLSGIKVQDVLPGPNSLTANSLSNPTNFNPSGETTVTTSGGRATVVWTVPQTLTPFTTSGDVQQLTFSATLDQAWVENQFNNHTPADGSYYTSTVQNYAQVTAVDQTLGSTPNNMAGPDGPVHEIDEASAPITIATMKTCVPTQANNNCQPYAPGPYLQVKKAFHGTQEDGCVLDAPCIFDVTVTGTYLGPVVFGDGMFTGPHGTLTSTSAPLTIPTTATLTSPTTATDPLCSSSSPANYPTGNWFCYNPNFLPPGAVASSNPNVATAPYTYTFQVSFTPTTPGDFTNCFFAMMWTAPYHSGPAPTTFQGVYTAGSTPSVPYWGPLTFGDRGACADAHTSGYSGMRQAPGGGQQRKTSAPPPCDTHGGPVQRDCKPVCKDATHWNGQGCVTCKQGEEWDSRHDRCQRQQACDERSTLTRGGACLCRYPDMIRHSQTMCGCAPGSSLMPGVGCVKPHASCDADTTITHGDGCICRYSSMTQSSPSQCSCPVGTALQSGRGCVATCHDPMVLNKAGVCACPDGTENKGGKCQKKSSVFDSIFKNIHIGVGVGVGGGGGGGGGKPDKQPVDNNGPVPH